MPFKDHSFEVIYGKHILHHLDLAMAAREIVRVLCPEGRAAFLEPLVHNPLLEAYRRLTPRLRSPTEKALTVEEIERLASHFSHWTHREFVFLSLLPALAQAVTTSWEIWVRLMRVLEMTDRRIVRGLPFLGRYYWQIVLVLEK